MRRARLGLDLLLLAMALGMGLWAWHTQRERRKTSAATEKAHATPTPSRMQKFVWERQADLSGPERSEPLEAPANPATLPVRSRPTPAAPTETAAEAAVGGPRLNVLVIQLTDPDGEPFLETAQVFSLDRQFTEGVGGGRVVLQLAPGPCTLQAQYVDAGLIQRSAAKRVVVPEDRPLAVTLVLPRPSRGDVGLRLAPREGYAEILGVAAGGAAEQMGLRPGDAVLAIDGFSVDGWSGEELEERLAGRAYQPVDLLVVVRNEQGQFEEHNLRILRGRGP